MLVKNSVIYLIGRMVPSVINFSLVALYTRLMAPLEYGKYALVVASAVMGFQFGTMWLNMAALRLYTKSEDKGPLLWSLLMGFLSIMGISVLLSIGLALVLGTREGATLVALGFLLFAGTAWYELNLHIMQARLEAMNYSLQNVMRTGLGGLVSVLLAWMGWGAEGILLGTIIGLIIPAIPMTLRLWRDLKLDKSHPESLRQVLAYGIPLSLSFAVQSVVNVTDRFLVRLINGTAAVGLYAVGFDTADRIIRSLSQPLGAAALPLSIARLEKEGPEGARQQSAQNLTLLLLVALPSCLGLIAVSPELVDVMVGPAFREMAKQIVPVVALTSIVIMLRGNYLDHAFHLGMKPRRQVVVASIVAVVNIILNFIMITAYGPVGAAYATLCAYSIGFACSYVLGRTAFRLPFQPGQSLRILAAALIMMVVAKYLPVDAGALVTLIVKTVAGGVTYVTLILLLDVNGARQYLAAFSSRGLIKNSR